MYPHSGQGIPHPYPQPQQQQQQQQPQHNHQHSLLHLQQPLPHPQHLHHHQQQQQQQQHGGWPGYSSSNSGPPPPYQPQAPLQQQQLPRPQSLYSPQTQYKQQPPTPVTSYGSSSSASATSSPFYRPQSTFSPTGSIGSGAPVTPPITSIASMTGGSVSASTPIAGVPASSPMPTPAPALYKVEVSDSQFQSWEQKWQQQQQQHNIKVEVSSSTTQPKPQPPLPLSLSPAVASPVISSTPSLARDVYAEIQLELKRQSQLQAIQQSSRRDTNIGGVSPQLSNTWNTSNPTTSPAIPSSMGSAGHSPFPTPSTLPQTPIGGVVGGWQQQPTPVEHQSSLTDITPPAGAFSQESSLTTLDPALSAANSVNARISRPYGSSNHQPCYPSAIEQQSSLTEIDGTVKSGFGPGNRLYSGGNFAGGPGGNFAGNRPHSSQGQSFNSTYPSAIEQQSSLTEIDSIPSALTEIDNIPSSLTVLDDLPHRLEDQSSLTVVDDLPYGLQEQSSLTEIDNLPHALSEQSPLTEVEEPKKDAPLSLMSGITGSKDSGIQRKRTSIAPATVTATARATAFSATSAASPTLMTTTTTMASPISPAVKAFSDANSAAFTMSNWSLPDDFTEPTTTAATMVQESNGGDQVQSPSLTHAGRAPALTHINTTWDEHDIEPLTPVDSGKPGVVLYPLSPTTANESGGRNSPLWKPSSLSAANSINRKRDSTPPVPPAKPASLLQANANRVLSPQSSATGAELTSEEICVEPSLPILQATPIRPVIEFNIDTEHVDSEHDIHSVEEDDDDDDTDIVNEIDEFEALLSKSDGVTALIRDLQSSMSLSRSPSGSGGSFAKVTAGSGDMNNNNLSPVKRNDSTSSHNSQRGNDLVARLADTPPEDTKPKMTSPSQQAVAPAPPVLTTVESTENYDLPRLATTQFEWTFSESEQATYERIYSLWERPAEECVSSDIAGKVFMTLGLSSHDLFAIWQMLNPEEESVLHRTQFIAGLHLVTCKVMGYALPDDLPDELMISAAGVGRIAIPPRPAQGPSSILPGAVLSEPVDNPQFQQQKQPTQQQQMYGYQSPMSPITSHAAGPPPATSFGSNFMHAYDFSGLGGGNSGPIDSNGMNGNSSFKPNESSPFMDFQQQGQQFYYPPMQQQDQQQHQQWPSMPNAEHYVQQALAGQPKSASISKASSLSRSSKSTSNSTATSAEVVSVVPSKPGPHALHDLAADAPVVLSFESNITSRGPLPTQDSQKPAKPATASVDTAQKAAGGISNGTTTTMTVVPRVPPIDYEKLYASPPDAFDHESAPPELDVEGNNIKYRSDFKNDMTVSASVTANHPINPKVGVFYFEITIDHFKGNSALSIGIASKSLRKNFQVGWDLNSWGFHSDDGFLYFGNGKQNIDYSYEYREGDTVGCGVNFLDKAVFFTINGEMMGIAFRFIKESIPLYPAIGLSQAGTEINANFGDQTFLFNIVDYKKSIMAKTIHTQPVMTWNNGAKNEKVFQILPDGLSVIAGGKDSGCIRGPKVSPRDKDVFYFEIAILYMPPSDLGTITVGVCGKEQSLTDVLGWKPGSYGYSSECGDFLSVSSNRSSLHARSQSGLMKARARGPPFRTGSVVGCGVDFASRELFFTLNGECLGHAFHDLDVLDCHPCVSVIDGGGGGGVGGPLSTLAANGGAGKGAVKPKSSGANSADRGGFEFKANFGQYPFMFDLVAFESNGGQ
ncbi:Ran-binding protein 10 [Linnemannia schmuckeri]|uniref:Ran-binding protein 10 n=1 Tax=Linnemannia schmuckeri TaxID=64567 RepID=A0A9P5VCC1_9FUNG|nr:Ran-binding protein 10 [Linnemannia schmuckeri]